MSEHAYETVKVPTKFRPLLRRLQRGTWQAEELLWLQCQHAKLLLIIAVMIRAKLAARHMSD
jgi:hypothetical protein